MHREWGQGQGSDASEIAGREREQLVLAGALDAVPDGRGVLFLIGGEAGIGKTALANWATGYAQSKNVNVLTGHCYDVTTPRPYGPWMDVLRSAGDALHSAGSPETAPDRFEDQWEFFEFVDRVIDAHASTGPVALVLEDIQWADESTLTLLHYVSRNLHSRPVAIIATYRDDEVTSGHPLLLWLPSLSRNASAERLNVQQLDDAAMRQLIRRHVPLSPSDETRMLSYLSTRAGGNPLFATELLNMLHEQGVFYNDGEQWILGDVESTAVPALVHQIVAGRMSALAEPTRRMLESAAVAGHASDLHLLRQIYPGTVAEIDTALKDAAEHRLLSIHPEQQTVRFSHELVRQSIYAGIPPLTRLRLHRSVGDVLAARSNQDVDTVAEHYLRAADEQAMRWLTRAAERAHLLHAPGTALKRCEQAIELASRLGVTVPVDIYRFHGLSLETLGDLAAARRSLDHSLDLARESEDQYRIWQALLDLGSFWAARDYDRAKSFVSEALSVARELGDPESVGESLNRLGNCLVNLEQFSDGITAHREALEIFERTVNEHGRAMSLDFLGLVHVLSGDAARSAEYYGEAIPLLRKLDERRTLVTALVTSSAALLGAEHALFSSSMRHRTPTDRDERYRMIDEALEIARGIGWNAGHSFCLTLRSRVAQIFGEFDVALNDARASVDIAREVGHLQWQVLALCSFGSTYQALLDSEQASACFEQSQRLAQQTGSRFMNGLATASLALTYVAEGKLELAESVITPLIDLDGDPATSTQRNLWYVMIELHRARGEAMDGINLLDRLDRAIPGLDQHRHPRMLWLRGNLLAELDRLADAEQALNDALFTAERFGYLPTHRDCLVSLRSVQLEMGKDREVERLTERVLTITQVLAESAGRADRQLADQFLEKVDAELREQQWIRGARSSSQPRGLLTRREREVLLLVAEGLSDGEVSSHLGISPRTVSQHLRSIYDKLDVNNRTAAVRAAQTRQLIEVDK